jgi:hypothetical protein
MTPGSARAIKPANAVMAARRVSVLMLHSFEIVTEGRLWTRHDAPAIPRHVQSLQPHNGEAPRTSAAICGLSASGAGRSGRRGRARGRRALRGGADYGTDRQNTSLGTLVVALADTSGWREARAQLVLGVDARVVATNIPGASAIAQVGRATKLAPIQVRF